MAAAGGSLVRQVSTCPSRSAYPSKRVQEVAVLDLLALNLLELLRIPEQPLP